MTNGTGMKYEVPGEMREFAEKSVDQARKAFDTFVNAAHKAVDTLQGSTTTMQSTATDATKKTLTYAEQSIAAAFDHAQRLVRATDMQEAMKLQSEFARTQFAALQGQMKDYGEMAQSAARSAASAASDAAAATRTASEQAGAAFSDTMKRSTES